MESCQMLSASSLNSRFLLALNVQNSLAVESELPENFLAMTMK
jgi:hypothetical protein